MRHLFFLLSVSVLFFALSGCTTKDGASPGPSKPVLTASFQPGVYPDAGYDGLKDTTIANGTDSNKNHGACADLELTAYATGRVTRTLLKFDLGTEIPSGATIKNAHISFHSPLITNNPSFIVMKLPKTWTEGEGNCSGYLAPGLENGATWNDAVPGSSAWDAPGSGASVNAADPKTVSTTGEFTLDLYASTVQSWLDSPADNHGIILRLQDEAPATDVRLYIKSKESGEAAERPKLVVEYTEP